MNQLYNELKEGETVNESHSIRQLRFKGFFIKRKYKGTWYIDGQKHGKGGGGLELEYFLDKHNIALAMCPPPFSESEVNTITSQELWDKSRDVSLCQLLMKQPFQCHDKKNPQCRKLEEYVIRKYHPYVIDIS